MALIHRFPVLLWQDHQGGWSARLLDRDEPAGIGRTAALALEQLEDYLTWTFAQNPWLDGTDFHDPELLQVKVAVRPEYLVDGRRFPCDEPVTLRIHAVRGRQPFGLLVCAIPTLDLRFYYHDPASLRNLISHYVQQQLESLTPQALARYLPPVAVQFDWITVNVRGRSSSGQRESSTPTMQGVAEPLGDAHLRRQFSRPYERDRQVSVLVERLAREKANVLLVGDPGSGKTTVLVEAVRQLERGEGASASQASDRERGLLDTRLGGGRRSARLYWQTSGGRLIAGMKYLGQWEERCERLIAELAEKGGVLCVDNLLDLVRHGGESPTNSLGAFFLPYLQRGELKMVAEATPAELDACRRLLPGLVDVFQLLALPPFSRQEAVNVLEHLAGTLASNHHLEVGQGVIGLVYHLFHRFLPYGAFPGKAAAFLSLVFDRVRQEQRKEMSAADVLGLFIRQTGLPELFLRDELPLDREEVVRHFRSRIIGQEEACQAAATLVTTFKAGLNDPGRPVGVLLFCGPTGVGKTEMAKAISYFFFGHGEQSNRLVRLDMSEYTGWRAGDRLLTQANGEPSELIQNLRQQPFVVLLLDEVEKADPEVFDVLLSVFDEGRLTDRFGRVTSFKSAVIIMTSNLGARKSGSFGFGSARGERSTTGTAYESEALSFFRPEFFNRIDAVVTFQPLGASTIRAITRKELGEIATREGLARARVRLTWSDRLEEHLAREGFDERYGARPLQRVLESLVVAPLARYLLAHPDVREQTVCLDYEEGGLVIRV
jgi:ATP-dependent Clp protease ATP-binding subunit ClpC